jgi:tetratricopeptide (TPR) repeat protein
MFNAKSLLPCALLILACTVSVAEAQQVNGQVRAADTGQPLYNAVVHCEGVGTNQIQQTDRSGRFTCRLGGSGNFKVRVDLPGYIQEEQSATAADTNSSEYMFFRLKPSPGAKANPSSSPVDANAPAEARAEFEKGAAAIAIGNKKKIEEAVGHLEKAISIYPKYVQAQIALGTAYMDLQQWEKAEQTLKKTIEINPKAANALFALGEIYLRQNKGDETEKVVLQGLQIEPQSFQGHLILARVNWDKASNLKDETKARPFLEKAYNEVNEALKINPQVAQAHLVKGNLLLRVRRAADAQREYEEYLRLDPKGPFADQTRALVERIKKALESEKK